MKRLLLSLALLLGLLAPAQAVVPRTNVGDAAYSVLNTDVLVTTTTAFTAGRTWTLPFAAGTCVGQTCAPASNTLTIYDLAGAITGTNTLTIAPQSGETINGNAANLIISAAGAQVILYPTTGSNWQAVVMGDYRVATLASGSAVSLSTATAANVTTISLSQGVWDCVGLISRTLNASTSVTVLTGSISTTTANQEAQGTNTATYLQTAANVMGAVGQDTKIGPVRLTLTATTTVYLVAKDTFTVSTNVAYGEIGCRRPR